jgi:hypothetical protein
MTQSQSQSISSVLSLKPLILTCISGEPLMIQLENRFLIGLAGWGAALIHFGTIQQSSTEPTPAVN